MPITATLSRKFYEKFGDEVTNELVVWLNTVDQSYRQEFRELFAAHFGQLRAELELRLGELRSDVERRFSVSGSEMDSRLAELRAEIHISLAAQKADLRTEIHERASRTESRLLRWMLGFWLASLPAMAGTVFALRQLGWLQD